MFGPSAAGLGRGRCTVAHYGSDDRPAAAEDEFGEWLEVKNVGEEPVDLNGWTLTIGDQRHPISGALVIDPGQYLVLARNMDPAQNGGVAAAYQWTTFHVPNSEGELLLLSPALEVVDRVAWGDGVARPAPQGASLERLRMGEDSPWEPAHAHWPGSAGDRGSPGAPYAPPAPTSTPIPSSTPTAAPPPTATTQPTLEPTETPTETPPPPTPTPIPPTATPPAPPRILLSEVMANPAAVADEAGEWLELFNADGEPVNLAGWSLSDFDQDRHTIVGDLWIQPGEYIVLGRHGDIGSNGGVPLRYVYTGIALANEADEVLLAAPWGAESDRVVWGNESGLRTAKGASLERTDFGRGDAWTLATQPWPGSGGDKGSPGAPYVAAAPSPTPAPSATPTPAPTLAAAWPIIESASSLLIDEVYVDASDHEYVTLYNAGASAIDLSGWCIGDAETPGDGEGVYALPDGIQLPAGGIFVVARNGQAFAGRWGRVPDAEVDESDATIPTLVRRGEWATGSLAFNNEGDEVLLFNPAMRIADAVAYGDGRYDAVGLTGMLQTVAGNSLQRVPGFQFPMQRDVRYRFLAAPPQPFDVRGLPVAHAGDHPALGSSLVAVWGTLGALSNFSAEGQAPPHYVAAAAAAAGLDFVAIADAGATHTDAMVRSAAPVTLLPAWRWRNAEGAEAVVYGPGPDRLERWADLRTHLETHGIVAQAQVAEPPSIANLGALAADDLRPDNLSSLYTRWRATGLPLLPAGNSSPAAGELGVAAPRYTGLAVERNDAASVLAALGGAARLADLRAWYVALAARARWPVDGPENILRQRDHAGDTLRGPQRRAGRARFMARRSSRAPAGRVAAGRDLDGDASGCAGQRPLRSRDAVGRRFCSHGPAHG